MKSLLFFIQLLLTVSFIYPQEYSLNFKNDSKLDYNIKKFNSYKDLILSIEDSLISLKKQGNIDAQVKSLIQIDPFTYEVIIEKNDQIKYVKINRKTDLSDDIIEILNIHSLENGLINFNEIEIITKKISEKLSKNGYPFAKVGFKNHKFLENYTVESEIIISYGSRRYLNDIFVKGYEYFPKDGNRAYVIAQFFPRMAVYSDVEGWQNHQFWGSGEFAVPFGNYEVSITVPADHVLDATGELQNRDEVFSKEMMKRYKQATKSYDKPVLIVTQEEAEAAEKGFSNDTKTWKFKATNVRDYAFATSRKFIWDMQAVKIGNKDVMAVSLYPKEGNPLWEEQSTKAVAQTLKTYSKHTFDYPYHKAISVHAKNQGMEYPMICWNYGRPNEDGTYSDRVKYGMISVIIHEVGHNFFPMIVNSDERQWGWMDEGLDTFMQYLAEQEFGENYPDVIAPNEKYPSRRGEPSKIVPYMAGDQSYISPIMSNPENVYQLGPNAYAKPATALNILRETVMGKELFDHAFKTYAQRWMFKHPTPEDFFRTMEDASAVDLDWFWRGWFYTTDYVDIGVKGVKKYYVSNKPTKEMEKYMADRNLTEADLPPLVYLAEEDSEDFEPELKGKSPTETSQNLKAFMMDNMTEAERSQVKEPKYFYEITFDKPGGIPMPLIVEYTYADGTTESVTYPPEIWRKNDAEVKRVMATQKEIVGIVVDPKLETADIDTTNNSWPKKEEKSDFDKFKENIKGK